LALWGPEEARRTLERYMAAADILFPGLEDMQMLYGRLTPEQALSVLGDLGCRKIVMKAGEGDVHVVEDGCTRTLPVDAVATPVDRMGAGDAFAAGCLAGLLKGWDLDASARLAITVAGLAIQLPGNIESMPTWQEVERKMNRGEAWKR